MKDTWGTYLALLRAGLWGKDALLPEIPDAAGWEELLVLAGEQAVQGLLLGGIARLEEALLPPAPLRMKLMTQVDEIARTNTRMAGVEARLLDRFAAANLEVLVMKGSRLARLYPHPEWRSCGDIDLYVKDFSKALSLFPNARLNPDGSALAAVEGVTVDLHGRYFDIHVKEDRLPVVPSPVAELLMTGAHILKHAIGPGVGLKQLCDMALLLDRYWGLYEARELEEAVQRAGLSRWWALLCSVLTEKLGLDPVKCGPSFRPVNPEPLMRIVRQGGNFGQKRGRRELALQRGGWVRKTSTALSFVARLPFSLRYAPKETSSTIAELVKGNL